LYWFELAGEPGGPHAEDPFMNTEIHPVDRILPTPRLLALGLQHVLVMYAGAVAVPLIIGRALKLPPEDVAFLISADLFACGLATLVQCIGFPGVGIRLPVMMGVTFASVGPMLSMAAAPDIGLLGIYGSVIAAGIFGILAAPFISRLLPLFPPVVTGTIILVIGISLMRVGINWAGGGLPTLTKVVDGVAGAFPNPGYGQLQGLGIALFVLLVILGLIKWGSGFVANIAVLSGIIAGAILASVLGVMHFEKVAAASWVAIVIPFRFGIPQFHLVPVITMCIVMIVVMIESLGMFLALGEITDKTIDRDALTRGLRADGVGTLLGGLFNTFPYIVLTECRACRRHRRSLALGDRGRRRNPAAARLAAENGGAGRGRAGGGARRRRACDVRHGRRHRRANSHRGRFQEQPLQPVRGRNLGRLRHDPAGRAEFFPQPAARSAAAAGVRHPAQRAGSGHAECIFQRRRQQGGRRGRCDDDGRIGAACLEFDPPGLKHCLECWHGRWAPSPIGRGLG
jgi:uracil-xanthine permease